MCGQPVLEYIPTITHVPDKTKQIGDLEVAYWPDGSVAMKRRVNMQTVPDPKNWRVSMYWDGFCDRWFADEWFETEEEAITYRDRLLAEDGNRELSTYEEWCEENGYDA